MILPNGMLGDLHWDLLVTPAIRSRFTMPMEELSERRRTVGIGGVKVETLESIDGLLYLCLHGSLSGGHQLVWLKDIDQMVASEPPDWDELVGRARRYRLSLVAAVQLERARTVLGVAVPEPVVETLAGDANVVAGVEAPGVQRGNGPLGWLRRDGSHVRSLHLGRDRRQHRATVPLVGPRRGQARGDPPVAHRCRPRRERRPPCTKRSGAPTSAPSTSTG